MRLNELHELSVQNKRTGERQDVQHSGNESKGAASKSILNISVFLKQLQSNAFILKCSHKVNLVFSD